MKIKPFAFSFIISLSIAFIFLIATFWIFYKYSWNVEAAKDALGTTGSYFGAATTLGAAIIAAYLFNDWKDQHNKTVEKEIVWDVVHKFDIADIHLGKFQDAFQNFKHKCQYRHEMPSEEFGNLSIELLGILNSLNGASLNFTVFLESVRKYSIVAEKTYFDDISNDIREINLIIFNTQNHKAHFPNSMNAVENTIKTLGKHVKNIEEKYIDNLLKELKALT